MKTLIISIILSVVSSVAFAAGSLSTDTRVLNDAYHSNAGSFKSVLYQDAKLSEAGTAYLRQTHKSRFSDEMTTTVKNITEVGFNFSNATFSLDNNFNLMDTELTTTLKHKSSGIRVNFSVDPDGSSIRVRKTFKW